MIISSAWLDLDIQDCSLKYFLSQGEHSAGDTIHLKLLICAAEHTSSNKTVKNTKDKNAPLVQSTRKEAEQHKCLFCANTVRKLAAVKFGDKELRKSQTKDQNKQKTMMLQISNNNNV